MATTYPCSYPPCCVLRVVGEHRDPGCIQGFSLSWWLYLTCGLSLCGDPKWVILPWLCKDGIEHTAYGLGGGVVEIQLLGELAIHNRSGFLFPFPEKAALLQRSVVLCC